MPSFRFDLRLLGGRRHEPALPGGLAAECLLLLPRALHLAQQGERISDNLALIYLPTRLQRSALSQQANVALPGLGFFTCL